MYWMCSGCVRSYSSLFTEEGWKKGDDLFIFVRLPQTRRSQRVGSDGGDKPGSLRPDPSDNNKTLAEFIIWREGGKKKKINK